MKATILLFFLPLALTGQNQKWSIQPIAVMLPKQVQSIQKQNKMSQPTTAFFIEGRLHKVFEMEAKNATFSTRDFIIEVQGQFPQLIKFQLVQDRCGLIDSFNVDEPIKVHFDLRGREWNGKYLTNLHAWKLDILPQVLADQPTVQSAPQAAPAPIDDSEQALFGDDEAIGGLPL